VKRDAYTRLSIMMFLEFFVWGAWYVTVGNYMARIGLGDVIYWAYTVGPIGAIISPFFLGMVADRFFSTEKVLGVLHLVGAVAMFLAPVVAESGPSGAPLFVVLLLIHMLCYMPTLALVNSLAFHHLTNQEKQFPLIRVFGTIGWIVAGVLVSYVLGADETALPLRIAAFAGLFMGLFSFALPHTPPAPKEKVTVRGILGLDALAQLKSRPFIVLIVCSLLICIPLAAYYSYAPVFVKDAGLSNPGFKMSFGQMFEVLFIVIMPFLFTRLGIKWMLVLGMFAWVLRYFLFAIAAPDGIFWMIMFGIILHGICYDFFFVAGQIFVDKVSTSAIRGQAQGFLVLMTQGIGMFIGAQIAGWIHNTVVGTGGEQMLQQWRTFWFVPGVFAGIITVVFALLFKETARAPASVRESVSHG
jgi:nucleoside transporter